MDYSKLSYATKKKFSWDVVYAVSKQDMATLKKLLPTAEDLLAFYTVEEGRGRLSQSNSGSSILHLVLKTERYDRFFKTENATAKNGNQFEFLKALFKEYDLDNQPQIKAKLLLKRDQQG
mgnify:CR=1 FL=1